MPQIAFRQIRTRGARPDWDAIRAEVEKTIDSEVKPSLIKKFKDVVSDWQHRVTFKARKRITRTEMKVYVFPESNKEIWAFVSRGTTGGYQIPKNPPAKSRDGLLHYQAVYDARTKPRGQYNLGSGQKSGPWVSRRTVIHPGVKAREFEEVIAEQYQKEFSRIMENAMRRGIRAAQRGGK
jgi:hypothetical protein